MMYNNMGASTVGRVVGAGGGHGNGHIVHGGRHFASLEKSKAQRYSRSEYHLMDNNNEFTDYDTIQRQLTTSLIFLCFWYLEILFEILIRFFEKLCFSGAISS
ncbi:hypothetical protein CAEBREN_21662 [Caenorhabditis brenneri]|uniref:Uncharacterized protein n=1 Tax=Caenorhabditis brenneri TaxID=135651 RepID=G0P2C7_CAEBE|nr:hypothetical protein CAEBREN_21662 [Caenorhabditis brenneri]